MVSTTYRTKCLHCGSSYTTTKQEDIRMWCDCGELVQEMVMTVLLTKEEAHRRFADYPIKVDKG